MGYNLLKDVVYWGYNPRILTFDLNFLGHPSGLFYEKMEFNKVYWRNSESTLQKQGDFVWLCIWVSTQEYCRGFYPPQIIHFNRVFHYKPSILGGSPPIFGNTHILQGSFGSLNHHQWLKIPWFLSRVVGPLPNGLSMAYKSGWL